MKRRTFIAGLGSMAAWPCAARAQRVGVHINGAPGSNHSMDAFACSSPSNPTWCRCRRQ
jgi:hypothetical protein